MTRMFYPPELDYSRQRDSFDPIREGERYGLLPKLSLAIWKRVSEEATDSFGRRNEDQALKQFHKLAARITARGRRLQPDPGRLTRVGTELNGKWPGTWAVDELMPHVPGRQTLVAVEARRWANWAGDASATVAGGSSGLVPRKVDEEMAQRELPGASEVAQVMASLCGLGSEGSALEALDDVTAGQASRLLANPPARDEAPARLWAMHDAGAMASPRRSFARSGGPSFVSRDLAAHLLPARDVSDIGDVEPALVDQGNGGEPLPPAIAARMRELLHHDFTHVRLHTDATAARAASALGARAFTLGNHIYFNRDQLTPDTPSGERLLIHELTHVVQYDEGRLPHADGRFKVSDPGSATEREARAAEDSASRLLPRESLREPVPASSARTTATGPAVAEIQRSPEDPPQTPAARVAFVREEGLNLRAGPDQKAASLRTMKFGQRVHVLEDSGKGDWLKIAVLGQTGYVYKPKIHFPPEDLIEKDPGLTLIKVEPGQTFWGLVKATYGIQGNESSRDQNINHFINAIRAVNKPEAFKVKTGILDDIGNAVVSGRDASDTELRAGVDLWIPSFGVAAKMDVGSGTVTGEAVRYAKKFEQKIDDFGAASRASGKYIPAAIGRNAGEMAMGMLQGLIDFAIDAAKILAGSTAAGALLGSLFGGVGAVPGAEIGFEIGMLILEYYGLYMLAEAVLGVAGKLLGQLGQFIALAWNANGDKAQIEKAGQALAEALGIFVSALLVVVAAYLLKRGAKALSKTKFAQKVGETRLAKWLEDRQKMTTTKDPLAKEKAAKEKAEQEKAAKEKARQAKAKAIGDVAGDTAADNAARDTLSRTKLGKREAKNPAKIQAELTRAVADQAKEAGRKAADDALANGASDADAKAAADAAARATADARANRLIELAKDPAHAKGLEAKGLREAEIGMELEESGPDGLDGPLTRDPNPKGGEFIDKHGTVWDVKTPNSAFPKPKMTVVDGAMADINDSLAKVPPEKVVIDPKDLTPTDLADLKARVKSQGLDKDVKFGK